LEESLPIRELLLGPLARIVEYERMNGRCPAHDFLREIEKKMGNRFRGQCDALTKQGADYVNCQRFRALQKAGKPLWELKEHDHRLYCARIQLDLERIDVVLLNGWIKDKDGKTEKETREIEKAQTLYIEFSNEFPGGKI
jgi:hypothetical protein